MATNTCMGKVEAILLGTFSTITYRHESGEVCVRPAPGNWPVETIVYSTFEKEHGFCEHSIEKSVAAGMPAPVMKPAATIIKKPQPPAVVPPQLSVQAILAAAERKKLPKPPPPPPRLALPKEYVMPTAEEIARAAKPPKIKSNMATAPQRSSDALEAEAMFDGDVSGLTAAEIAELRGPRRVEAPTGQAISPFDSNFDAGRNPKEPARRSNKPISVFDR